MSESPGGVPDKPERNLGAGRGMRPLIVDESGRIMSLEHGKETN
jgi:hypothetical protein